MGLVLGRSSKTVIMFSRTAQKIVPQCTQVRGMATLKDLRIRLKSVTNIQKITKSMKMVSAAKYAKAERELKPAVAYGSATATFYENVAPKESKDGEKKELAIGLTSDRGLCGGVHSSIFKAIRSRIQEENLSPENLKVILVGDKSKAMMQRLYKKYILTSFNDIGRLPPVFQDASKIAQAAMDQGYDDFSKVSLYYNKYRSVVSYVTTQQPLYNAENLKNSENLPIYDSIDDEALRCYNEFALASYIYYGLKQAACSEQSSRMTAMDAASKNAGEVIDKLTLTFNRTRQAVITKELIEIISGAAAL